MYMRVSQSVWIKKEANLLLFRHRTMWAECEKYKWCITCDSEKRLIFLLVQIMGIGAQLKCVPQWCSSHVCKCGSQNRSCFSHSQGLCGYSCFCYPQGRAVNPCERNYWFLVMSQSFSHPSHSGPMCVTRLCFPESAITTSLKPNHVRYQRYIFPSAYMSLFISILGHNARGPTAVENSRTFPRSNLHL